MLEPAPDGRVYRMQRRIRLADTSASGRLRLDAVARYVQDIATDDVADAGIDDGDHVWIVRRAAMEILSPFSGDDTAVRVATWSGGLGARWATRRTSIAGDAGGRIETETLWAFVHAETLKLSRLPPAYHAVYGNELRDAAVSGKLLLPRRPPQDAARVGWPLRVTDNDILGHDRGNHRNPERDPGCGHVPLQRERDPRGRRKRCARSAGERRADADRPLKTGRPPQNGRARPAGRPSHDRLRCEAV